MITKILKVSLIKEQVEAKIKLKQFDGYEVHLLGDGKDDFSLLPLLASTNPIKTFHYPVDDCDLSVFKAKKEYDKKVIEYCSQYNAGLIMHCGTGWDEDSVDRDVPRMIKRNTDAYELVCQLKANNVPLHLENASGTYTQELLSVIATLAKECEYLRIHPLLDICHYQIAAGRIFSKEMNLGDTLCLYSSSNYKIHFCDSIGCGKYSLGGYHGTNFKYNQPLMKDILRYLLTLDTDVDLVLEVDEEDYSKPLNAIWLAEQIDKELEKNKKV